MQERQEPHDENKTLTDAKHHRQPSKWRKPVPCPICGDKGTNSWNHDFSFCWNVDAPDAVARRHPHQTHRLGKRGNPRMELGLAADYKKAKENAKMTRTITANCGIPQDRQRSGCHRMG